MTGFSIDWLDLREAVDHSARDVALLARAQKWLHQQAGAIQPTVVDLGAGTGSTLRAFAASGGSDSINWRLVDQDAGLLVEAANRHGRAQAVEILQLDLANTAALPLTGAQLITASALLDLVSAEFVDALLMALQQHQGIGLYSALNYDGTTLWTPAHPLDEQVLSAFNADQQRDKGFGRALGPEAGPYTGQQLQRAGFEVRTASSPWQLDGRNRELVAALIDGIAGAVASDPAIDPGALRAWCRFRQDHVASGSCIVGHMDLLALPVGS